MSVVVVAGTAVAAEAEAAGVAAGMADDAGVVGVAVAAEVEAAGVAAVVADDAVAVGVAGVVGVVVVADVAVVVDVDVVAADVVVDLDAGCVASLEKEVRWVAGFVAFVPAGVAVVVVVA